MLLIAIVSSGYLIWQPPKVFPQSFGTLIPVIALLLLTIALFLVQNKEVTQAVVVREIARLVRQRPNSIVGELCTVIRFDIDRLKAISNYSNATATAVRNVVRDAIDREVDQLRRQGRVVSVIPIPGEDETVLIVKDLSVNQAADVADEVRRRVKTRLSSIPYFAEAVALIADTMEGPPAIAEEQLGIGTVSAGVAAYRGNEEISFSDASAAVKESKCRGRNKTVVYRPGQAPEIRSDYKADQELLPM